MASICAIFTSTYRTKQLNPWPNSSASHVANYSWLLLAKGMCSHLKVTWALMDIWQASETSHSKSSPGNFQHQYLPELLVNVYSYRLMVKVCFAVVCVEAGFSQIRSHVNNLWVSHDLQIKLSNNKRTVEFPWIGPKCLGLMANTF